MQIAAKMATKLSSRRNVVVVGKTGSGKSSVANYLISPDGSEFKVSASFKSVTQKVSHADTVLEYGRNTYSVTVFDTVGLFDTGMLSNKKIMDEVQEYAHKHAPDGVNLVLFVMKKGRFSPEEKEAFEYISKRLGENISAVSAMVLTHCDNEDEEARQSLINDFRTGVMTKQMASCMKKGIYTVGFPDKSKMKPRMKALMEEDIEADRKVLLKLIADCSAREFTKELSVPVKVIYRESPNKWCNIL